MKKSVMILSLALAMIFTVSSMAMAIGDDWVDNFEKAKAQATKEGKDILIDFTGSDWCGWCIKLDKEVFQTKEFKDSAPKDFILVALDFPRDKTLVSPEIAKQNAELQKEYGVRGFPTLFLTDAKGRPYAQAGYQAGGPEKYLPYLAELKAIGKVRDENLTKARRTKDKAEKAKYIDQALAAMPNDLVSKFYSKEMQDIIKYDRNNEAGLKVKYEKVSFDQEFNELVAKGNYDKAQTSLEEAAKSWKLSKDEATEMMSVYGKKIFDNKVNGLRRQKKYDEIITLIDDEVKAKDLKGKALMDMELTKAGIVGTKGEIEEAIGMVDGIVKKNNLKGEELQNAILIKANIYQTKNDMENLNKVLEEAVKAAPDTPLAKNIQRYLDSQNKK
ncbi:MAG: thioredoxin family protein [Phycisphaerae bacterium]|nr:thioredoxin family protein [Phycisphaerae bacterium]